METPLTAWLKVFQVRSLSQLTQMYALSSTKAETVIQLGPKLTRGLGAGGQPEVGRARLLEESEEVLNWRGYQWSRHGHCW